MKWVQGRRVTEAAGLPAPHLEGACTQRIAVPRQLEPLRLKGKLPGKLKENEKPYEKFISLISALRASAKCTSPFYIEMGRPFYFNGGSVPFAFKLELNYISIRWLALDSAKSVVSFQTSATSKLDNDSKNSEEKEHYLNSTSLNHPYQQLNHPWGTRVPGDPGGRARSHCFQFSHHKSICNFISRAIYKAKQSKNKKWVCIKYETSYTSAMPGT